MSKRPAIDLNALTSEAAAPMAEAVQRVAKPAAAPALDAAPKAPAPALSPNGGTPTANLEALAFKVSPTFRKRFRQCAVDADLKLNELLFEALDAWEEKRRAKR